MVSAQELKALVESRVKNSLTVLSSFLVGQSSGIIGKIKPLIAS